jgi:hypothetical protein
LLGYYLLEYILEEDYVNWPSKSAAAVEELRSLMAACRRGRFA